MTFLAVCDNDYSLNTHYVTHCARKIQYKPHNCITKF